MQEACGRDSQQGRTQLATTIYKADFVKVDPAVLYDLIKAASCPKGKDLLDQVCQRAANIIKDKQLEDIHKTFVIKNNFTPKGKAKTARRMLGPLSDVLVFLFLFMVNFKSYDLIPGLCGLD